MDGVFVAADGTDCPCRSDCTELTAGVISASHEAMKQEGINPARLKMAAICSVCAEAFANHMKSFSQQLEKLREEAAATENTNG
jgi:coenzyme F420-reducing hydrogenase delta subunit